MPTPANLVHEISTTTGTGSLTLANVNGKNNFNDAFGTSGSDVFDYFISNQSAAEWERGTGSMSDSTTLVRDTVIESTNSNAAVDFSAGTKDVTNDVPASEQFYKGQAFLRGYLHGLGLSNNSTDGNHDIDIAIGECASDDYDELLTLSSAITKQIDAAWSVGTNAGGIDTGSVANSTWYHVFLIKRTDTGVVDALFSASISSPTMPTNYDEKRRIGSVRTDASGNIIAFVQHLDEFRWTTPILDVDATDPGTSAVTRTLTVPTGLIVNAMIALGVLPSSTNHTQYVSPLAVTDQAPLDNTTTPAVSPAFTTGFTGTTQWFFQTLRIRTNTSGQVRTRSSDSSTNDRCAIVTYGWIDDRGKLS